MAQYGHPIGDFYLTSGSKAKFNYKTQTICHGMFIRKKNWRLITNFDASDICLSFKRHISFLYHKMEFRVLRQKRKTIELLKKKGETSFDILEKNT